MLVENISNFDALLFVLALIALSAAVFRAIPPVRPASPDRRFTTDEITRHDQALPKYILTAAAALVLGALHLAVKSIPAVAAWIETAGRGGHLFANIAYSHMIIVLGGTIAVTGLVWYALPRILGRPLYSDTLAHLAFWGTLLGAGGFYAVNVGGGLAMGALVRSGLTDAQASDALGMWRALPTAAAASLMGLGYWLFVVNVLVTCWQGRGQVRLLPLGHLAKYFALGAIGLFVGTIHGVLQVVPENEDWLAAAGQAGRYIDPIAHAHVNLITGMMMLVGGLLFFLIEGGAQGPGAAAAMRSRDRRRADFVFWTLGAGSLLLYLTFLVLGLSEGGMIVDEGRSFGEAVQAMGARHVVPLLFSGALVLLGFWTLLTSILIRVLGNDRFPGAALIMLGLTVLFLGTLQGGLQALPVVKAWLVAAGEGGQGVARAHAQLNMLGGVLPLLLGSVLAVGRPMLGADPEPALGRRVAWLMGGGVALYYLATMAAAIGVGQAIRSGEAAQPALFQAQGTWGPFVILGGLLYAAGAALLLRSVWQATHDYRRRAWDRMWAMLAEHDSTAAPWRRRMPAGYLLLPEALAALFGFPGLGWILSGRALIGVPLAFAGPALAWAILPLLFSPYSDLARPDMALLVIQGYLLVSAALSVGVLWVLLGAERRRQPRHS